LFAGALCCLSAVGSAIVLPTCMLNLQFSCAFNNRYRYRSAIISAQACLLFISFLSAMFIHFVFLYCFLVILYLLAQCVALFELID